MSATKVGCLNGLRSKRNVADKKVTKPSWANKIGKAYLRGSSPRKIPLDVTFRSNSTQNDLSSIDNIEAFVRLDEPEVPDMVSVSGGGDVAGEWENFGYRVLC